MQYNNTEIPKITAARLLLRLPSGLKILTDTVVITDSSYIIVRRLSSEQDSSVPCIHLIPIENDTDAEAPSNTAAGAQSKDNDNDLFTTLVELSEKPVDYDLAVMCPLQKCSKFGPVDALPNHYMQAHANHNYTPDSDE